MARLDSEKLKQVNGHAKTNGEARNRATEKDGMDSIDARTDLNRWRLLDEDGRQTWHYLESKDEIKEWPQSIADRHHLGLPLVCCLPPHPADGSVD